MCFTFLEKKATRQIRMQDSGHLTLTTNKKKMLTIFVVEARHNDDEAFLALNAVV